MLINIVNNPIIGKYVGLIFLANRDSNNLEGKHKNIKNNTVLSIYNIILQNKKIYIKIWSISLINSCFDIDLGPTVY